MQVANVLFAEIVWGFLRKDRIIFMMSIRKVLNCINVGHAC